MRSPLLIATCAAVMLAPCFTFAAEQLDVRPGYWQFTQTMTPSGAPIYIEAMTDAQRASYAKAWAKDAGKPQTSTDQQCITPDDLNDTKLFQDYAQEGKECTQTFGKQTRTAWSLTLECKDAKTSTRSQVDYTAPSPDRLNGYIKSSTTSPIGTTVLEFRFAGKWVAATCPDEQDEDDYADEEPMEDEPADE